MDIKSRIFKWFLGPNSKIVNVESTEDSDNASSNDVPCVESRNSENNSTANSKINEEILVLLFSANIV